MGAVEDKKLCIWIGNMFKGLVEEGIPIPAVQGILASTLGQIYYQPIVNQKIQTEEEFKQIVNKIKE